jgi:hypothetical protein
MVVQFAMWQRSIFKLAKFKEKKLVKIVAGLLFIDLAQVDERGADVTANAVKLFQGLFYADMPVFFLWVGSTEDGKVSA